MYLKGISLMVLIYPTQIFMFIFSYSAVMIATQGYRLLRCGFRAVIFPNEPISEDMRNKAISLFRLLSKTTVLAALLTIVFSAIASFGHADDMNALGHQIATVFSSLIFGILMIGAVFEPIVFILKTRQANDGIEVLVKRTQHKSKAT
jgi:flagellar motor component MotA